MFVKVNNTGPLSFKDFDDVFMIGPQYFQTLMGMQWNFDTKKVALMLYPGSQNLKRNPVDPIIKPD